MSDQDQTEAELERTRQVVADTVAEQAAAADAVVVDVTTEEDAAEVAEVEAENGWESYTVEELQDELRTRGLAVSGNKAELVARLEEDDA